MNGMNWNKQLVALSLLIGLTQCTPPRPESGLPESDSHSSKYLIEASELAKLIDADSIKIIDMRSPEEYTEGHLPNAIHIWRKDIQDNDLPYSGMIASKEHV